MAVAFAGSDQLAARVLEALARRFEVAHVITQPDRPAGRGLRRRPTPVRELAERLGVPAVTPERLDDEGLRAVAALPRADILAVCSYGLYIPEAVLALYPRGGVNFHPSLLPRYRGASPIVSALLDGAEMTGVSVIEVAREMDAGGIYAQVAIPIDENDTARTLTEKLLAAGIPVFLETIERILAGSATAEPQRGEPTYCRKIGKEDRVIDWTAPARAIHDRVRAFAPTPGAVTGFRGRRLKVLETRVRAPEGVVGRPGEVVAVGPELLVAAGQGAVAVLAVHPENGRAMSAREFVNGYRVELGEVLGGAPGAR